MRAWTLPIATVKIPDKRVGQGADPYGEVLSIEESVGAAALGGPLAAILQIAISEKTSRLLRSHNIKRLCDRKREVKHGR